MQGMQVAAEPLSAPPYATECAMTLDGTLFAHVCEHLMKLLLGGEVLARWWEGPKCPPEAAN